MATSLDMIKRSMRLVEAIGSGETPTAAEQTDGLAALNSMLDSWSTENLTIYAITDETFTWASGQISQTIGASGDFDTTRPIEIEGFYQTQTSIDYPVEKLTEAQYVQIPLKTTQSSIMRYVYPDSGYPLITLYAWPVPSVAATFHVRSWTALQSFTAATTALAMPPGYQEAIEYNLAVNLASEYGREVPRLVYNRAVTTKRTLKRGNTRVPSMVSEPAYMGGRTVFDYHTGDYRR